MSQKCLILILSTNIILTSTASLPEVNLTGKMFSDSPDVYWYFSLIETNNTRTSTTPIIASTSTLQTNIFLNKTVSQGVTSKPKHSNVTASQHSQHPPVKPFEGGFFCLLIILSDIKTVLRFPHFPLCLHILNRVDRSHRFLRLQEILGKFEFRRQPISVLGPQLQPDGSWWGQ